MDYYTILEEVEKRLGKDFADRLDDAVAQRVYDAVEDERIGRQMDEF